MADEPVQDAAEWWASMASAPQPAPVEISGEVRAAAAQMHILYLAFQQAGFTQGEALVLIANMARPPA